MPRCFLIALRALPRTGLRAAPSPSFPVGVGRQPPVPRGWTPDGLPPSVQRTQGEYGIMKHPKRNRGARSGWPLAVPRTLIASLALVGAVALPGLSWGQAGCGGGIANDFDLTATPPANLRFVGDTLRVKATVFNVNNQTWTVDEFVHKLDCDNAGSFSGCVDDGAVLGFVGYVSTTCQDASDVGVS